MPEIVNLNRARKRRATGAAALQAAENRVRHGRTKAEKVAAESREALRAKLLDNARIISPIPRDDDERGDRA